MKYYTPTIEEFHFGFEFEKLEVGSKTVFHKEVIDLNSMLGGYDGETDLSEVYFRPEQTRVKYLDREDIESLGFVNLPDTNAFDKGECQINFQDYTFIEIYDDATRLVFQGTIKNKSELKRILKQLRI